MTKDKCQNHPNRIAAVLVGNVSLGEEIIPLCWECYIGEERFKMRFGENFYGDAEQAVGVTQSHDREISSKPAGESSNYVLRP